VWLDRYLLLPGCFCFVIDLRRMPDNSFRFPLRGWILGNSLKSVRWSWIVHDSLQASIYRLFRHNGLETRCAARIDNHWLLRIGFEAIWYFDERLI